MAAAPRHQPDRFGLSWRPDYSASILCHTDEIDLVEIIADNFSRCIGGTLTSHACGAIAHHAPFGLARSWRRPLPVETKRLEKLARLFDICTPESWSEHLAFVRAGGREIGHLAAPPRNDETIDGAIRNVRQAARIVGCAPVLENIATLIRPPLSTYGEWPWIDHILKAASCDLLLDLHNLLANCANASEDPARVLKTVPLDRVQTVHLSGGKWIKDPLNPKKRHLLDDHLHDVPDAVYDLLAMLAELCPNPLTVIIERDGHFPEFEIMLDQLRRARAAVAAGRAARAAARNGRRLSLSTADVEAFLARLYTDEDFLARFLDAPRDVLARRLSPPKSARRSPPSTAPS